MRNALALALIALAAAAGAEESPPAFPFVPADESRIAEIAALLPAEPAAPGARVTDRAAWERLARLPQATAVIRAAEGALKGAVPVLTDELYLEFYRSGNRVTYETPFKERNLRLQRLALAEAIERKGRFLPQLCAYLEAILRERTWVEPAHDRDRVNLRADREPTIDLGAAARASTVAYVTDWFRSDLPPELVRKSYDELNRRIFSPYERIARMKTCPAGTDWWFTNRNNWNAVVNGSVVRAALAMEPSRERRARFVEAALRVNGAYVAGFEDDGYCSEGIGYWNYGFGHELKLGLALRAATDGKVDLFADPKLRRVMEYAYGYQLERGLSPHFADGMGKPDAVILALCRQVWPDVFGSEAREHVLAGGLEAVALRAFGQDPGAGVPTRDTLPVRTWLPSAQVLVARENLADGRTFALAVKGGYNHENHNHNDVGSYEISFGGEALAGDPGAEQYTAKTFSAQRYESNLNNSYGHPVPVVAGRLQEFGAEYRAKIVSHDFSENRETLVLDLKGAYRVPALTKLERTVVFDRMEKEVTVTDRVAYSTPQAFSVPVLARASVVPGADPRHFSIRGERTELTVSVESSVPVASATERIANPNRVSPWRIRFDATDPVASAEISVTYRAKTSLGYLEIVEAAVAAYSDERMERYTRETEEKGVQEHGFPRLAANLAVLVANGRQTDKRELLGRMMDAACRSARAGAMPRKSGGNDFTVKELVLAVAELERAKVFEKARTDAWRGDLSSVEATRCYTCGRLPLGRDRAANWVVYACASEQARIRHGMGGDAAFVEKYVADQLRWFDANGMYRDPDQPIVYDLVTRLQFAFILSNGYDGPSRAKLEEQMEKSAQLTLDMLSATGEIPYGGRSNQFLHNHTFYAALCDWYAARCLARGDAARAEDFRRASFRARSALGDWLANRPVRHVKNLYPIDSGIGCETYAYFDKYMVTMGSWAMMARTWTPDGTRDETRDAPRASGRRDLSPDFHQTLLWAGDYSAQVTTNADTHYDADGIGRFQRRRAPSAICLATPCTTTPRYRISATNRFPLAIGPFTDYRLSEEGLDVRRTGEGAVAIRLPVFTFDGESEIKMRLSDDRRTIEIPYRGWVCRYVTDGRMKDAGFRCENRNGTYRVFEAVGEGSVSVRASIERMQ